MGGIFVTTSGGGTLSAGSGFTLRVNNASTSHRGLEDQNVTAAGSYAATASYSSSQTWIAHLLALKRTSGGGTRAPTAFYVSNAGSDANTGLDPAHSWAHAPGMTGATGVAGSMALIPGDAVLLRSWRLLAEHHHDRAGGRLCGRPDHLVGIRHRLRSPSSAPRRTTRPSP